MAQIPTRQRNTSVQHVSADCIHQVEQYNVAPGIKHCCCVCFRYIDQVARRIALLLCVCVCIQFLHILASLYTRIGSEGGNR